MLLLRKLIPSKFIKFSLQKIASVLLSLALLILIYESFGNSPSRKIADLEKKIEQIESSKNPIYLGSCKNRVVKRFEKSVWTMLTDSNGNGNGYELSAVKLVKSIRANTKNQNYDTYMLEIYEKPLSKQTRELVENAGWIICTVNGIPVRPGHEEKTIDRFVDQYTKLIFWNMTEFISINYFDSDTLVLRNIDALLNIDKKLGSSYVLAATRGIKKNGWKDTFNFGVFVLKPNRNEYKKLMKLKDDPSIEFEPNYAEQNFLNVIYKNRWYEFGFLNNANLAVFETQKKFWLENEEKINVLHFTNQKPWKMCDPLYKHICDLWDNY